MSGVCRTDLSALDFGAQGGDPSRGVDMDLSTCVNRYGPAPAAIAALRAIEPADILLHPYDAAPQLIDLYREATGVPDGAMITGRGASEFIWAMGRELDHASVQVPMPAYTDYLKAFPGRGFGRPGDQIPSLEQIDAAMNAAGTVIISNPHNPTGAHLDPDGLVAVAAAHPTATLVVDESYIDFTPDPVGWSVIGCETPNIVVLRSTTKFYGIAATRTGIAWCAEPEPLTWLFGQQENWGLSGVDVRVACAAVRSFDWTDQSRAQMLSDSAWLAENLCDVGGLDLSANRNVHFQYAFCERSHEVAEVLRRHGIGVRVLGAAHGVRPDALRIVAPRYDERDRFAAAIADVVDERVAA
ncbi:aminotransferase class I/II-fold pyridoxal phosphate-dependent enzyme [Mycobacterium sp.]|uniref:aminotransferase class I/II-fold pyridoxal phosphate-dependent enzyme n=1 Tax=Mycobacterium sp. TaxID=1785 RepID=UPI002D8DCC98|nr:aminotransferase class I/II-fold pyridoxal phosphate-dependent enzyme [Mycobacterium sp.]